MPKAALDIRFKELEKELKELREFPKIIEEKDFVISEVQNKHREELENLKVQHELKLEQLMKSKDKELENAIAQINKRNEAMSNDLQRRIRELNKLIDVYGNTLKGIQG